MTAYYDQPLRKLLGILSPTITWLSEKGTIEVNSVPGEHVDAIKQLERIGVVHKRNNRLYELQKIRLKKLMDSMGIANLQAIAIAAATPTAAIQTAAVPAVAVQTAAVSAKAESAVGTLEPPVTPVDPGLN
jgi:hypothetical protein